MANISEDLDTEDVEQMLFLLSDTLPREKLNTKVKKKVEGSSTLA